MYALDEKNGRLAGRRWRLVAVAAGCLVVALAVYTVIRLTSHGDPDPGGRILAALQSIESAVPEDAAAVSRDYATPHWDSCDGRAGTFGWSSIGVYVKFESEMDQDSLIARVNAAMAGSGWAKGTTLSSPRGHGQQWTRALEDGTTARAQLTPSAVDGQTTSWQLTATAPAHGPRASGC